MQRVVNAEVKTGIKSSTMIWDSNIYYPRDHCLSNNTATKMQTKKTTVKDFRPKKAKIKNPKPTLFCIDTAEPSK